ncbi:MAG: oxaloacetate decarboxylase [Pigmentiphaga sp.]
MTTKGRSASSVRARRIQLKNSLNGPELIVAPGVFDMVSARLADALGFKALYMSGYATVASYLGWPDAGLATFTDMVNRVQQFATITDTPLICDGDTGYGGLLNVMHTVRGYEAAGASAIQLEDQEAPKKCGHMAGRRVIPADEMVQKIRVAVESRDDPSFVMIARTDALAEHGLDEALRRGERYARAGADVLFVEGLATPQELARVSQTLQLPLVFNMVAGTSAPLSFEELQTLGYRIVLCPVVALMAAAQAMLAVYESLAGGGHPPASDPPQYEFREFSRFIGFDWVGEFDQHHAKLNVVE